MRLYPLYANKGHRRREGVSMELWIIGYMFTLGAFLEDKHFNGEKLIWRIFILFTLVFLWPVFWGTLVFEKLKIEDEESKE